MHRIAIAYGFSEGPTKARRLARVLAAHGYQLTSLDKADIIITHSGGCHMVPADVRPQFIWAIAPTVGLATRTPLRTQKRKMWHDIHSLGPRRVFARNITNMWYIFRYARYNVQMWQRIAKHGEQLPAYPARAAITVCQGDPWAASCPPADLAARAVCMTTPDNHDDIWYQPESYVRLLTLLLTR